MFLLNLIFETFLSSSGIKFTCNAPEIRTLQKIKNSKPPRISKTEMEHGSTFCATLQFSLGYFLSKKNNCTYQRINLANSLELSPNLGIKISLQTTYFKLGIFVPFLIRNILHKKCP